MATTNFVDGVTLIEAEWCNEVDYIVHDVLQVVDGTSATGDTVQVTATGSDTARTLADRWGERYHVKDFGVVGDGTTDDTSSMQAAFDFVNTVTGTDPQRNPILMADSMQIRTTAPLTCTASTHFAGNLIRNYWPDTDDRWSGTWFHFDHTGIGIDIQVGLTTRGATLRNFGTRRTQPTPGAGWAPTAHDFDIFLSNSTVVSTGDKDVTLRDLFLLNPTKGIGHETDNVLERLLIQNLIMQAFDKGIQLDNMIDVLRMDQLNFRPYWSSDSNVLSYMSDNLDCIQLSRCDNPQLANIFTIYMQSGIRLSQSSNGRTSKLHLVNADFDLGSKGIWIDDTNTTGATVQGANVTFQGRNDKNEGVGLLIEGNNSRVDLSNFSAADNGTNGICVAGSGNTVNLNNLHISVYNKADASHEAIDVASGNAVKISQRPEISGGTSSADKYGGDGTISVNEWRDYTPTVDATSGTITTVGAVTGKFKIYGGFVDVYMRIQITDNGTGAGSLRFTLPFSTVQFSDVGFGRNLNTSNLVQVYAAAPGTTAIIQNYDGTYPIGSNETVICNLIYPVTYTGIG